MGITRVADVTRLDTLGVPVYQSIRPGSKNLSVSQGKGLTREAARVSAVMESVEMWHAENLEAVPRVETTLLEMENVNPISRRDLRWRHDSVPLEAMPLDWVEIRSLTRDRPGWLPRSMVELDFTIPRLFEPDMFVRNSNGLASGNTREEALLHALCELVERHAWRLAQDDPGRLTALDPDSLGGGPLAHLLEGIRSAGCRVAIYDMTWELGVPAVFARLVGGDLPVIWNGAGCHTSREVALARAVTEAAQSRLTFIAGARDDLVGLVRGGAPHRELRGFEEPVAQRRLDELPDLATDSVADDLARVVARLDRAGYEPFWIDLRRDEPGFPVVVAFVPGLLEMHAA